MQIFSKPVIRKTLTQFLFAFVFLFSCFLVSPVHAQQVEVESGDPFGGQEVEETLVLDGTDIRLVMMKIIRAVLSLLGIIALGIVLYGGYIIMTSGGAEDKVANGKKIIINGVIGLAIILSSVAIVQFVISRLSAATGARVQERGGPRVNIENFAGSGALGEIVRDHYPFRYATSIKRNTRIVVTFAEPINPASLIQNTNNTCWGADGQPTIVCQPDGNGGVQNPYYGDCLEPANDAPFSYADHCDRLDTRSVAIYRKADAEAEAIPLVNAAAMTTYEDGDLRNAYTFVFKPLDFLGSNTEHVSYIVDLKGEKNDHLGILKKEGQNVSAFVDDRDGHYFWEFETDTLFDFTPPHVEQMYPNNADPEVYRNTILQITFNEPVDPTVVQGISGPQFPFSNIIFRNQQARGEWKITNGYRTVEFVPAEPCGTNSCGDTMYCLTTNCEANDPACTEAYGVLARTARLIGANTFEARPFSGVMDMGGNALDGRTPGAPQIFSHDGVAQGKPDPGANPKLIDATQTRADNFWWDFTLKNAIDRRLPNIESVRPFLDEGGVKGVVPLRISFSLPLWFRTMHGIDIAEYPGRLRDGDRLPEGINDLRPLWTRPLAETIQNKTVVTVDHREFGPNNFDLYYFPSVPSTLKAINQNCFYPGRGPLYERGEIQGEGANRAAPICEVEVKDNGDVNPDGDCAPVTFSAAVDTGCVTANTPEADLAKANVAECITRLERDSIRFFVEAEDEE